MTSTTPVHPRNVGLSFAGKRFEQNSFFLRFCSLGASYRWGGGFTITHGEWPAKQSAPSASITCSSIGSGGWGRSLRFTELARSPHHRAIFRRLTFVRTIFAG